MRAFDLASIQTESTFDEVLRNVTVRAASAEYYRFWWFCHTDAVVEWRARKVEPGVLRRPHARPLSSLGLKHAAEDARAWVVGMFFGFHLLQFAYWVGTFIPALLPVISALWYRVQFSGVHTRVDRSDKQFNFNCLFKQHVDEWAIPVGALPAAMRALRRLTTLGPREDGAVDAFDGEGEGDEDDGPSLLGNNSSSARGRNAGTSGRTAKGSSGSAAAGPARRRAPYRVHFPVEVRFVAPDSAWLSPSQGPGPVAYVGVIMYKPYGKEVDYKGYFRDFEAIMGAHGGRPHWAKDFGFREADFARAYPRWGAFKALRARLDPGGVFLNPWARRMFGLPEAASAAAGGDCDSRRAVGAGAASSAQGAAATAGAALVVHTGLTAAGSDPVPHLPQSPASFIGGSSGESVGTVSTAAPSSPVSFAATSAAHGEDQTGSRGAAAMPAKGASASTNARRR